MKWRPSRNVLPILLASVALLVWVYNGYKFLQGVNKADDLEATLSSNIDPVELSDESAQAKYRDWVYEPKFRDPFENWLVVHKKARKPSARPSRKKRQAVVPTPALRFIGVIQDDNGKMAILEDRYKEIHFCFKGDVVEGVKILSVDSTKVDATFKGKRFTFALK